MKTPFSATVINSRKGRQRSSSGDEMLKGCVRRAPTTTTWKTASSTHLPSTYVALSSSSSSSSSANVLERRRVEEIPQDQLLYTVRLLHFFQWPHIFSCLHNDSLVIQQWGVYCCIFGDSYPCSFEKKTMFLTDNKRQGPLWLTSLYKIQTYKYKIQIKIDWQIVEGR